jgi:hypothetical protein
MNDQRDHLPSVDTFSATEANGIEPKNIVQILTPPNPASEGFTHPIIQISLSASEESDFHFALIFVFYHPKFQPPTVKDIPLFKGILHRLISQLSVANPRCFLIY